MSEPKVIELTKEQMNSGICVPMSVDVKAALMSGQDVLLKAPRPKLVHLSDLPDGTRIEIKGVMTYFASQGKLFAYRYSDLTYTGPHILPDEPLTLVPGEFQVWQGGECPWPEGVKVEVILRNGEHRTQSVNDFRWTHTMEDGDIIAHRCIGLMDGWKLVP